MQIPSAGCTELLPVQGKQIADLSLQQELNQGLCRKSEGT